MGPETVSTFFAVMLIGAVAGTAVGLAVPSLRAGLVSGGPNLMAMLSLSAMAGSLYLSEVAGFVPCELCWFQRIAMYPLAVILSIAAVRVDRSVLWYAVPLSLAGLAISIYHVQLQLFPDQGSVCDLDNPCTGRWVEAFGWMTIPQMAAISFALITTIGGLSLLAGTEESP